MSIFYAFHDLDSSMSMGQISSVICAFKFKITFCWSFLSNIYTEFNRQSLHRGTTYVQRLVAMYKNRVSSKAQATCYYGGREPKAPYLARDTNEPQDSKKNDQPRMNKSLKAARLSNKTNRRFFHVHLQQIFCVYLAQGVFTGTCLAGDETWGKTS